jgi:hypothetical protein
MTLYQVNGWDLNRKNITVIVDTDDQYVSTGKGITKDHFVRAQEIAGEGAVFATSSNLLGTEASVINAERELLLNKVLDNEFIKAKFEAARKAERKIVLAQRRKAKKAKV